MTLFASVLKALGGFQPDDPIRSESELESRTKQFLEEKGFQIESQVSKKKDRYDLIIKKDGQTVCLELKLKADISDIEQFDRYMPKFREGFIVMCWNATDSMRDIFDNVIQQTPTPIALIELSARYSMV